MFVLFNLFVLSSLCYFWLVWGFNARGTLGTVFPTTVTDEKYTVSCQREIACGQHRTHMSLVLHTLIRPTITSTIPEMSVNFVDFLRSFHLYFLSQITN